MVKRLVLERCTRGCSEKEQYHRPSSMW